MKIVQPIAVVDTGTFSRSSTATYYNSTGIITSAAVNERRITYDPSSLSSASSELIESATTNQVVVSSFFDDAVWNKSNLTVVTNTATDPANTTLADKIVENAGAGFKRVQQSGLSTTIGSTYTYSVFVKAAGRSVLYMDLDTTQFSAGNAYFNLTSNTVTATGSTGIIQALPNGWYRCSITATANAATSGYVVSLSPSTGADSGSYTGDGTSGLLLFGAQMETGPIATSYIPTTVAPVTRAADVPASNFRSNIPETDYAAWSSATTYALGARVIVVSANVHMVYESLQASNTNHAPATSPTWWLSLGATNRWKVNDTSVQSQSTNSDSIHLTYTSNTYVDTIALLNLAGSSARVVVTHPVDGVVYDSTANLSSSVGIIDWYTYFFNPIDRRTDIVFDGIPLYANVTVDVYIYNPGNTAAVGTCILGQSRDISYTKKGVEQGAKLTIVDYSLKQVDSFGNYSVKERAFSKKANFTVYVNGSEVDSIQNLLASRRAVPTLYIGGKDYGATIIYGFYKSFDIDIAYIGMPAVCTIEIEGLT